MYRLVLTTLSVLAPSRFGEILTGEANFDEIWGFLSYQCIDETLSLSNSQVLLEKSDDPFVNARWSEYGSLMSNETVLQGRGLSLCLT